MGRQAPMVTSNFGPTQGCGCVPKAGGCGCSAPLGEQPSPAPPPADLSAPRAKKGVQRLQGPPAVLHALTRRWRQLALLSPRCTFYERHEVVDRDGRIVERSERGEPFVFRRALGLVPIDPNEPFLDDGAMVSQTSLGYTDAQGRWHRVVRYQRHPGPESGRLVAQREAQPPLTIEQQRRLLTRLLQEQLDPVPVAILLRDQQPTARLPSRTQTGLAFHERHRADTLTPRRRALRAENHQRRLREAGTFKAWIRSIGGRVTYHATLYGSLLSARIPRRHLSALLARPEVAGVEPRAMDTQGEYTSSTEYLCSNLPSRLRYRDEPETCDFFSSGGVIYAPSAYLDAVNAATGVMDYLNAGYNGYIDGGLSNWGHRPGSSPENDPTLTYGVRDGTPLEVNHPAFKWAGRSRFLYYLRVLEGTEEHHADAADAGLDDVEVIPESRIATISPVKDTETDGHATRCAAIAMANSTFGEDPDLITAEQRQARSGVARKVSGLAAVGNVQTYEMLDSINSGFKLGFGAYGEPYEGIDVISSSQKEGHGASIPGATRDGGDLRCPSEEDARGLDYGSRHIVFAFTNDGLVFAKAGGNDHDVMGVCIGDSGVPIEVSPPGASPAAISSSALDNTRLTAAQIQSADTLRNSSCRDMTLDERSYPLLTVPSQTCGVAGTALDMHGQIESYEHHGQTSATAPRVAGSALIFKHWYLAQYGSIANTAGHIIVNLLNFADGFAKVERSGLRASVPYEGWGLGRLGLRLYPSAGDTSGPTWGTTSRAVVSGVSWMIDITGGSGSLPSGVRHLRITAWWLEVNTGDHEIKADIQLILIYRDKAGDGIVDYVKSDKEHVLRMQYDRDDATFDCPPGAGPVYLILYAPTVPDEARSSYATGGYCYSWRVIHISWFWETGEDPTRINCEPVGVATSGRCSSTVGGGGDPYSFTGTESPELRAMRASSDAAVCGALRISTGLGGIGTSPVFEAGRRSE